MLRIVNTVSNRRRALAFALALVPLAAGPLAAAPQCKKVHAHLFLEVSSDPDCQSPIGLCATATVVGNLRATTDFVGLSIKPVEEPQDPPSPPSLPVVLLIGDNVFHTDHGDFFTKDSVVLSTVGAGEFAEVDFILGGTGAYTGATGVLTATGTFANGTGEGILEGEICTP